MVIADMAFLISVAKKDGGWVGYLKGEGYITRKKLHASQFSKEQAEETAKLLNADNAAYTCHIVPIVKGKQR